MNLEVEIKSLLQKQNNLTFLEILTALDGDPVAIGDALYCMARDKKIKYENDHYFIQLVFAPFRNAKPIGNFSYSSIAEADQLPQFYMNTQLDNIVQRMQGQAGTCAGQSGAASRDLEYVMLTGELPTEADKRLVERDVDKGTHGSWYDILYPQSFSAAWLYYQARKEAGQPDDDGGGAYIWAICKVLKEQGCCLESQWRTPKDGRTNWKTPWPGYDSYVNEKATTTAPKHTIDGYSAIITKNDLKLALIKHGYALIGIRVYDAIYNHMEDGEFIQAGEAIGGHAVLAVGYDQTFVYVVNSWENCPKIWKMTWTYYQDNIGEAFVILDDKETKIAKELYSKINFTSTYPAEIKLGDKSLGITPTSVMLNTGISHTFTATFDGRTQTQTVVVGDVVDVHFTFRRYRALEMLDALIRLFKR